VYDHFLPPSMAGKGHKMSNTKKNVTLLICSLVLLMMVPSLVMAGQSSPRSNAELERALRATKKEFKEFKSLQSKLESAGRQSSNASRKKVILELQDFMGKCIQRREAGLGEEITIKQHGEMVKSGTTDAAHHGSKGGDKKSANDHDPETRKRLNQLSRMKSSYVSTKTSSQPAIERQSGAFERYSKSIDQFGQHLDAGIGYLSVELENREVAAEAKEKAAKAALVGD